MKIYGWSESISECTCQLECREIDTSDYPPGKPEVDGDGSVWGLRGHDETGEWYSTFSKAKSELLRALHDEKAWVTRAIRVVKAVRKSDCEQEVL